MENKGKDHLAKRIGEPGSELDAIRMALELPAPESDDENYISDTSAEEGNEDEAIVVSISKGNGSEISEEDIGALRGCARIKGLIIREPAEKSGTGRVVGAIAMEVAVMLWWIFRCKFGLDQHPFSNAARH